MANSDNVEPVAELQSESAPAVPEPESPLQSHSELQSAAQPEAPEPAPQEVPEEGWQVAKPKRRGRPPGSKNKPKIVALPPGLNEDPEEHVAREEPPKREPAPPVYYEPPRLSHQDLGSILSEHLLQVERQKRLSQQEMYARLVRGVL